MYNPTIEQDVVFINQNFKITQQSKFIHTNLVMGYQKKKNAANQHTEIGNERLLDKNLNFRAKNKKRRKYQEMERLTVTGKIVQILANW